MSGSDSKFLRKFFLWAGVKSPGEQRRRREAFDRLSHKQKGTARRQMQQAMDNDPTPIRQPILPDHLPAHVKQEYIENLAVISADRK